MRITFVLGVDGGPAVLMRLLAVLMLATTRIIAQHMCDHCNCPISSTTETQAIFSMGLICNTGTITWFGASGALRLELTPFIQGHFRACFVADSENTHVKISQENSLMSSSRNYRLKLEESRTLKLDHLLTSNSKSNEFCVSSANGAPVLLYIEAVRTPGVEAVPKVLFHYDVEKMDSKMLLDPTEECRPCTKEEILDSYCSMDFVVIGSISEVSHNDATDKSHVRLAVKQVIHQIDSTLFHRVKRSDPHLTGHVAIPRKCGIQHGDGDFLITGRVRLGQLALTCAPYLHEWRRIRHEAECTHG